MAKHPIAWHENCLANRKNHLESQIEIREALDLRIKSLKDSISFSEMQIRLAKDRGVTSFDPDLFLKKLRS